MQKEVEYLGFLLTIDGLKPKPKKVEVMNRIKPPTNSKKLKRFLGMINFYQDMRPKRSHILTPLWKVSLTTGKRNWRWRKSEQKAFDEAKEMPKKAAVLAYPDFGKPFDLYTDVCQDYYTAYFLLFCVISHTFSRKLLGWKYAAQQFWHFLSVTN